MAQSHTFQPTLPFSNCHILSLQSSPSRFLPLCASLEQRGLSHHSAATSPEISSRYLPWTQASSRYLVKTGDLIQPSEQLCQLGKRQQLLHHLIERECLSLIFEP